MFFNTLDSVAALSVAFLINAGILVMAATVFYGREFSEGNDWIRMAYRTLSPLLGTTAASTLFAVALLASGQSSTITGTLAGQVVMEGFTSWKLSPFVRRLFTRSIAIIPAIIIIGLRGSGSVNDLLTLSQVVLAIQLPFAILPLLHFTSSRKKMGIWTNGWLLNFAGWGSAFVIIAMDLYMIPKSLSQAWRIITG